MVRAAGGAAAGLPHVLVKEAWCPVSTNELCSAGPGGGGRNAVVPLTVGPFTAREGFAVGNT